MRFSPLLLVLLLSACDRIEANVGEACLTSDECMEGALCFAHPGSVALCMTECPEDVRLCPETAEVCVAEADGPSRVCYLGGAVELGEVCISTLDCEVGAVCVQAGDGLPLLCESACDVRDEETCGRLETCVPTEGNNGYCAPTPEA